MTDDQAGAVFGALADPMRRRLLTAIAEHPSTATELATALPISRQAVSKHLHSLSEAGLLDRERAGRDVRYRVTPGPAVERRLVDGRSRRPMGRPPGAAGGLAL